MSSPPSFGVLCSGSRTGWGVENIRLAKALGGAERKFKPVLYFQAYEDSLMFLGVYLAA